MREFRLSGSVRGVRGNPRPYRDTIPYFPITNGLEFGRRVACASIRASRYSATGGD